MSGFYYLRELNVGLLIFAEMVNIILLIGAWVASSHRNYTYMRCFFAMIVSFILVVAGETLIWVWTGNPDKITLMKAGAFLSFGLGAVLNTLFLYCVISYIGEHQRVSMVVAHVFAAINSVFFIMVVISLFNGILFSFTETGDYIDGSLYWIVSIFDIATLLIEFLTVIFYRKKMAWKSYISLLSFSVLPLLSIIFIPFWVPTPQYLATSLSLILLLIVFYGETVRQLSEKEIQLQESEKRLADSRISIALSQMRPHFLYNVLNSIYYLCSKDPDRAQIAISFFSDYLRNNMESIEKNRLVPIEEELSHVRTYLELEKIRFSNLRIEYDISASSFFCPPLSLQPLVENAVKHGVSKKRGGGVVRISTYETDDAFVMSVSDTGVGFDCYKDDGKVHIGIRNVRERVESMTGGSLSIESHVGEGTVSVVTIPKENSK
ncbi:MAG: histidine kinase [Candidatus Ornithospirochaeta sp.]|nr:histidine kinase [Candidatus Ornithospirochaeta sp.]